MSSKSGSGGDSKEHALLLVLRKEPARSPKLIAGPTVFICDECVELCMDIIREEHKTIWLSPARVCRRQWISAGA